MKYLLMSCSHRVNSESLKVTQHLKRSLERRGHEVKLHDCGAYPLPLWDPDERGDHWPTWQALKPELKSCEGLILVTPEWHGMATPQAKNFFLLAGSSPLAHKAGLIVSVSAGRGGAYPIAELRLSSYKNSKLSWIPEHLIIRQVESVLNEEETLSEITKSNEKWIRDRIDHTLEQLELYTEALNSIRDRIPHDSRFGSGM